MQRSLSRLACVLVSAVAIISWDQTNTILEAQSGAPATRPASSPRKSSAGGSGAVRAYNAAVRQGPIALHAFLVQFPKGANLHVHLSGAIYAETFIRDAAEDGLCVDAVALKFTKPPCADPLVPAVRLNGVLAPADQDLYDRLINSFSMRSFVPSPGFSGHDQFFGTFSRYGGIDKRHTGEWVDEVATRAAAQNQQYLEVMETPAFGHAAGIAREIGWPADAGGVDFARQRQALLDRGLRDEIAIDRQHIKNVEARRRELEHCGTPQAVPACKVEVRYIYQVLRGWAPEQVFAQTLLGFETVEQSIDDHDEGFVGLNFVMPEDGFVSMRDYSLHMKMVDYLHGLYPKVHISLHAGELAPGLVTPEGLRFHIRQAVETGHAERIGHGVDVMYEDGAAELMKEMAGKHVMVEANLSSNDGILGIKGNEHPFPLYRAAHVPVALSTDDEGVSRIEITGEYVRAALDYHLSYADLKQLARTGLEHDFLPGESLWARPDVFTIMSSACRAQPAGAEKPSAGCQKFLHDNEKAAAQWELERRFGEFESRF
jgi:adenosine deaminase